MCCTWLFGRCTNKNSNGAANGNNANARLPHANGAVDNAGANTGVTIRAVQIAPAPTPQHPPTISSALVPTAGHPPVASQLFTGSVSIASAETMILSPNALAAAPLPVPAAKFPEAPPSQVAGLGPVRSAHLVAPPIVTMPQPPFALNLSSPSALSSGSTGSGKHSAHSSMLSTARTTARESSSTPGGSNPLTPLHSATPPSITPTTLQHAGSPGAVSASAGSMFSAPSEVRTAVTSRSRTIQISERRQTLPTLPHKPNPTTMGPLESESDPHYTPQSPLGIHRIAPMWLAPPSLHESPNASLASLQFSNASATSAGTLVSRSPQPPGGSPSSQTTPTGNTGSTENAGNTGTGTAARNTRSIDASPQFRPQSTSDPMMPQFSLANSARHRSLSPIAAASPPLLQPLVITDPFLNTPITDITRAPDAPLSPVARTGNLISTTPKGYRVSTAS